MFYFKKLSLSYNICNTKYKLIAQRPTKKSIIITFGCHFVKTKYIRNRCFTISFDNALKAKTFFNPENDRDKIIRQFATNNIIFCFSSRLRFNEIV